MTSAGASLLADAEHGLASNGPFYCTTCGYVIVDKLDYSFFQVPLGILLFSIDYYHNVNGWFFFILLCMGDIHSYKPSR